MFKRLEMGSRGLKVRNMLGHITANEMLLIKHFSRTKKGPNPLPGSPFMITLELHSPQPPAVVLNSLRELGAEWRQSQIPPELWRLGVAAVESRVWGSTCTLTFRHRWYGPVERGIRLSAEGTVLPDSAGTRVMLDVAYRNAISPWLGVLVFGVATLIGLALFGVIGLWFLVVGAASLALQYSMVRGYNRDLRRVRTTEEDFLVRRIESAVASAGAHGTEMVQP